MFLIRLINKKEMSLVRSVSEDTGMPPAPLCSDARGSAISPSFQLSQELGRSAPKLGQRQSPGCGRWTGRPLRGLLGPSQAALTGWGWWSQGIPWGATLAPTQLAPGKRVFNWQWHQQPSLSPLCSSWWKSKEAGRGYLWTCFPRGPCRRGRGAPWTAGWRRRGSPWAAVGAAAWVSAGASGWAAIWLKCWRSWKARPEGALPPGRAGPRPRGTLAGN